MPSSFLKGNNMAEYINVEKPFLDKLRQLGWQVIDQGIGVPQEPAKSLRENFKQVLLPGF
jgi:type I restriction enzyme R subunit